MARHRKIQPPDEDEPGLDISSLIDVCFLLLIYFLVTTQIVKKEQELSTALPAVAPSETPPDLAPMLILLEANGSVSIKNESGVIELIESNADVRKLSNLSQRLELHKSAADVASQKALVQIRVDGDAVQQRVTDVLNALAGAKITEITFTDLLDPEAN
ncbi:MAG: biopolymer transport protein ExbD [Akkermansiaceae bacterium]|jgi:biopolymer transport protein ExbD